MKHLFILNSFAGKKDSTTELREKIEKLNLSNCVIEATQCQGDAKRIAEKHVKDSDEFVRVYACGGDGTANEALCGMIGYDNCALGVIPVGTGNDFVRSFDYELDDFRSLEKMVNGEITEIDIIECEGKYGLNCASIGYDCAVAELAQKIKRVPLVSGAVAYKVAMVLCLFTKRRHTFVPYAEGQRIDLPVGYNTQMLAVCGNGQFYGGGIKATPYAQLSDGELDFMSIPTVSLWQFLQLVGIFIKGEHIGHKKADFIVYKKCKSVQIKDEKEVKIGIDGEIFTLKDPVINILPKALSVIVPKNT